MYFSDLPAVLITTRKGERKKIGYDLFKIFPNKASKYKPPTCTIAHDAVSDPGSARTEMKTRIQEESQAAKWPSSEKNEGRAQHTNRSFLIVASRTWWN